MKEYKLSAKSKYSVLYLLCGLFMFFFMFSILSLSSFAQADGSFLYPYYTIDNSNTDSFVEMYPGGTSYSSLTTGTKVDSYYHVTGRVNVVPDSLANAPEDFVITLNTSDGSFNLCSGFANYSQGSKNISFDIYIKGKYSSLVRHEIEHCGGIGSQYALYTYTVLIDSCTEVSSTSSDDFNFSDYSSYSPVSILSSFGTVPAYGTFIYNAGQIFNFTYPNYNGTSAEFANAWIYFKASANSKHNFTIVFQSSSPVSAPNLTLYVRSANDNSFNSTYSFTFTQVGSADPSIYRYYCSTDFVLPTDQVYKLYLSGSYPSTISSPSYSLTVYKGTIADYMQYVQSQWNNISPSVTDLNQNTAQSISDIGSAQTFETSAFDNFDTQFSNSGLDAFSMSFASTPLLWVSSIITTFYNNMPSTFQYLLMFVAFVGILCTVLNVFGRVAQRFGGGDSATKLNSKDVFSKIEKNGSI